MLKSLRRKTIGDLRANRGQFLAVWLMVTLGTTFFGAMYPAAVNLLDSVFRTYDRLEYMDFQVQVDSPSEDTLQAVRAIPGVESAEPRLVVESSLQPMSVTEHAIILRLISVPDERESGVNRNELIEGHDLRNSGDLLLLESFANYHDLKPGDTLRVTLADQTTVELRIAGLVFNPEYLVAGRNRLVTFPTPSTFGVAWMPYSDLAELAGQPGEYNDIVVRLEGASENKDAERDDRVRLALTTAFEDYPDAVIYSRLETASGGVIDANINGNFPAMAFFSGLFLTGAAVITGILLARMVESERQRIGTMRAMGITRRELVTHYLAFGFIIGLTGGFVGSILGYLNSFWFMNTFLDYIVGGTLPGYKNIPQIPFILLGYGIVLVSSTIAGAYPAWVQSATPPGIALRPATPKTPNAISRTPLGFLPLVLRQTIRNLLRAPGRSSSTALGVIAGAMMVFSSLALWDTMAVCFGDYYDASAFDLQVTYNGLLPADSIGADLDQIDGITGTQPALIGPAALVDADGERLDTIAVVLSENEPFFDLTTVDGDDAFSNSDGVWISHNIQRILGVGVGDTLTIRALGQAHDVTIQGIVLYTVGSPVFVPQGLVMAWAPGSTAVANTILVRANDEAIPAVQNALAQMPGVAMVENIQQWEKDLKHFLNYFAANTVLFGSFGVILTIALLYNTVNASLRERRDELSILRALGSTRREIALTVTLELLIMVTVGVLIGVPLGREAGYWLLFRYNTDFFGYIGYLTMPSYLVGIAVLLATVFLAEIPGLRAVQKTDLGQISKSQSF
ncbi:MAG: FtsX-like permease family protein [Anaerolineae bacterium]|nr:FtsX-like permease family protein [Anaerolineae bacterium]